MSVNKVILVGNVGADPEVRYLDSRNANDQQRVASLRVATSERYKTKEGETKELTEWHDVVLWGRLAEVCEKYVKKGLQVYVEGSLRSREYMTKDGQKRTAKEIRAAELHILTRREGSEPVNRAPATAQAVNPEKPAPPQTETDDDLPF